MVSNNGGPATPTSDGWINYGMPIIAGLMYRDSIEVDELKHPFLIEKVGLVQDSGGAGKHRGAPPQEILYTARENPMQVVIPCDGQYAPPRGVRGGKSGVAGSTFLVSKGNRMKLPNVANVYLRKGQSIHGIDSSGGGYGEPLSRDPKRVLNDVFEGYVSLKKARETYGVVCTGRIADGSLTIDTRATAARRKLLTWKARVKK